MTDFNFIRNAKLTIGPFKDDKNAGPGKSIDVFSDGAVGLRFSFSISKTINGGPNQSTVSVFNFAPNSRALLLGELARINLFVGWRDKPLAKLSSGGLLSSVTERGGPDLRTTMSFFDGYAGVVKGVSQRAYGGNLLVSSIVRDLAGDMPGIVVVDDRIRVEGAVGYRGRVVSGRTSDELNKLAEEYGFSWSVQNGVFQAVDDGTSFSNIFEVSVRKRNLIKCQPILSGASAQQTGVEITAVLDAGLTPGDRVSLASDVNAELNGEYKVHNIDYTGDTFESAWEMKIQSFRTL